MKYQSRRRSPRNKDKDVRDHFNIRLYERYGIVITKEEYQNLIDQIHRGEAKLVEVQSLTRKVYKISLRDKEMFVVYNPKRKLFHTVLFPNFSPVEDCQKNNNLKSFSGIEYKN